ncbi:hypothetical protein [Nocardia sp. NBC_00511]|uniref:hypothetical protein n=1 Tax=Nocardia sp. NBC_00511 TaxID=2903591 RepID=UPI0030E2F56F
MGGSGDFGVRVAALHAMATTLREESTALAQRARAVDEHAFGVGGDSAGRNYAAQGRAVHDGFERVAGCLRQWGTAAAATADVFDRAAAEYARIDRDRSTALAEVDR